MSNFGTYIVVAGALYPLGSAKAFVLADAASLLGDVANLQDFGNPGAEDFTFLGPGGQSWNLGYSIQAVPAAPPTATLGFVLELQSSYDSGIPFNFFTSQEMVLPVQDVVASIFSGSFRLETPAARFSVRNDSGVSLTLDYSFWQKAF